MTYLLRGAHDKILRAIGLDNVGDLAITLGDANEELRLIIPAYADPQIRAGGHFFPLLVSAVQFSSPRPLKAEELEMDPIEFSAVKATFGKCRAADWLLQIQPSHGSELQMFGSNQIAVDDIIAQRIRRAVESTERCAGWVGK